MDNINFKKTGKIGVVTINRPEALNALNTDVYKELDDLIKELEKDNDVKVVVITGAGEKAFVAGADISEMKDMNVDQAIRFAKLGNEVFLSIENMTKPVIAAIEGFALGGGCELALACDMRIAGKKAKFSLPEVNLGIMPGNGGTQ
ncbi:MAG: enoyl-CoA hydratase-related protein, partial [Dehalobacterium sp.]